MAKYASYYAPINQALQNFNAQMNENYRRRTAAEYATAQSNLALAKFNAEMDDPRRILAMEQAADQLRPTQVSIGRNMPTEKSSRYELEQWNKFKPNVNTIIGDPGARIEPNGTIVGSDGRPLTLPKYRADQVQTQINAAQMFAFDEETMRRGEISAIDGQIKSLQEEQKKTNNPHLALQIKGMETKRNKLQSDLDNPNRRLISLRNKMNQIDQYLAKEYTSQNPNKGWTETLKWQASRAQAEYNSLLKALGKDGSEKGIQLKKYVNPHTKEVIEYPVSKFEGAKYRINNPIAGGVQHLGSFVLEDSSNKILSGPDAVAQARAFINDYQRDAAAVTALKNAIAGNAVSAKFLQNMDLDPNTLALLSQDKIDVDAAKQQIGQLEATMKYYKDELQTYQDPQVRRMTEGLFGTKEQPGPIDDPEGLTSTKAGSKYINAPNVLFEQ